MGEYERKIVDNQKEVFRFSNHGLSYQSLSGEWLMRKKLVGKILG